MESNTKDDEEGNSKSTREPLQQYATKIFGDTLVTGVPNIVNTHSWPRKIFKLCVLLFCISGFLYQTIQFLTHVFSYPSIVDITVHTPSHYLFPAITICNNNGVMRSKFCHKYPERCETPSNRTAFCEENPAYSYFCRNNMEWEDFAVPKREFYKYETTASIKDLKELSHDQESLFNMAFTNGAPEGRLGVKGPLIFFKNEKRYFSCYTIHFRANSSEEAEMIAKTPWNDMESIMEMEVDFEPTETFLPGRMPGGFLHIHSPFDFYSPFEFGHRIRPGKFYKIHIKQEEEELLPYPYKSDCVNYTDIWESNGRKGSRSQEMCKLSCVFNLAMKSCNCSLKFVVYPYDEDICFTNLLNCDGIIGAFMEIEECAQSCKDDCKKNKISYILQEREVEEIDWESEEDKEEQKTYLSFFLSDPEVVVLRYRPHYHNIEIFGYIGGYIGAWLGISLVAVVDFVECLILVFTFAFRRRKQTDGGKVPALESKSP